MGALTADACLHSLISRLAAGRGCMDVPCAQCHKARRWRSSQPRARSRAHDARTRWDHLSLEQVLLMQCQRVNVNCHAAAVRMVCVLKENEVLSQKKFSPAAGRWAPAARRKALHISQIVRQLEAPDLGWSLCNKPTEYCRKVGQREARRTLNWCMFERSTMI